MTSPSHRHLPRRWWSHVKWWKLIISRCTMMQTCKETMLRSSTSSLGYLWRKIFRDHVLPVIHSISNERRGRNSITIFTVQHRDTSSQYTIKSSIATRWSRQKASRRKLTLNMFSVHVILKTKAQGTKIREKERCLFRLVIQMWRCQMTFSGDVQLEKWD